MGDNSNRTMSERIIDRFMRKSEKDQTERQADMKLDF